MLELPKSTVDFLGATIRWVLAEPDYDENTGVLDGFVLDVVFVAAHGEERFEASTANYDARLLEILDSVFEASREELIRLSCGEES